MAEATKTYLVKQAFWHKQQLQSVGTESQPNTVEMTDREARYHLFANDIVLLEKDASQTAQAAVKPTSKVPKPSTPPSTSSEG